MAELKKWVSEKNEAHFGNAKTTGADFFVEMAAFSLGQHGRWKMAVVKGDKSKVKDFVKVILGTH
ncbi:MAG: hypothetical protein H7199_05240 [Burkholderiales bacterium]|nr:hypothetical protein [Flavobacterium sp.]